MLVDDANKFCRNRRKGRCRQFLHPGCIGEVVVDLTREPAKICCIEKRLEQVGQRFMQRSMFVIVALYGQAPHRCDVVFGRVRIIADDDVWGIGRILNSAL
ncbi:hypothetical protein [Nitrobacter hamburgensis]|uniref:hypothetical protein n=1 Tax=Nitrobacter hamburgensis TaxID=912 RepID=UPI001FD9F2E9|nr:hypothetical protein [Nitrobacter hamburgensis]